MSYIPSIYPLESGIAAGVLSCIVVLAVLYLLILVVGYCVSTVGNSRTTNNTSQLRRSQ